MKKIGIVTDANSGISVEEGKLDGIYVVPMPFIINGEEYFEGVNLTQDKFYELLLKGANVSTSQPSTFALSEVWNEALKECEKIIYIPMSSGLSNSCQTATILSTQDEYEGKVFVINNQRISVTQKNSVYEAVELVKEGKDVEEIVSYLNENKLKASIYIMLDTLTYLKKGGRVTPTAAALANLLNIKPVLQIQGEKLDSFTKVLSSRVGRVKMINQVRSDLENRFKEDYENKQVVICLSHTNNYEELKDFEKQVKEAFLDIPVLYDDPLSLSIACHIGPGALAITIQKSIIK